MIVTQPYCRVVESLSVPKLGAACVLAHSTQLGYVASVDAPNKVELWRVFPMPVKLATMTPPTNGLGIASWSTCAASDDTVCVVYAGSYNGDTTVLRYLQVYRNDTLSPALLLADISSEWFASEKSRVIWTGTQWLVSTRVKEAGNNAVRFQWVSADGTTIEDVETWTRPEPFFAGASLVQDGHFVYAAGLTSNNVDTRTVRRATINLDTRALVEDALIDSAPMVDTPQVGQHDGIETLWWKDAIYSRLDLGPITVRFLHGGDLQVPRDARLIVTKDVNAALVAQVSAEPTILTPWDGVTPEYRASCASGENEWMACATVGETTRFWRLELTDEKPPPPPPPKPDTFGPKGDPSPDGYEIEDLSEFIVGDATKFPRIGTHPVTQHIDSRGHIFWGKFYNGTSFKDKGRYEEYAIGQDYVHLIADVSNNLLTSTTDTRWLPRKCKVGLAHLFRLPPHELIDRDRNTGEILNTQGWARDMGVIQHWNEFDFGPDLGVHEAVCILHDNTGGAWAHDRGQELYIYGRNIGCVRWSYYRTDRSMPGYVFNDWSLKRNEDGSLMQSDFYTLGGVPWVPDISPIQLPISPENTTVPEPIPALVQATMAAVSSVYPLPPNGGDGPVHEFSRRVAEQVAYTHNTATEEWGLKSTSDGSPVSNNITRRVGSKIDTWDYIVGGSGPAPTLNIAGAEHFDVSAKPDGTPAQHFIPVTPTNHLAVAKPTPGRAQLPASGVYGVDAFDLGPRTIGKKDFRWLEQVLVPNALVSRQFMYATPMAAPRLQRDAATGLAQVRELLPHMRARKARGSVFTILCGTRNDGWSWADALDYCRQCNALFLQYPELVVGVDIFNENLQGFEQDYATNTQFLREAEACFDLRFPVAPGSAWGDQPPLRACGSYLVPHADRAFRPRQAAANMIVPGWQTLDREGMGITEPDRTAGRQRVADVSWAAEQLAVVDEVPEIVGSILHIDAGMTCDVGEMPAGGIQAQCVALYGAKAKGAVVTPPGPGPIPPPGSGHPILDVDMGDESKWYPVFVGRRKEIEALAFAWYTKSTGHQPADSDIAHGFYWRSMREWMRWGTLRAALENTWPGGAP